LQILFDFDVIMDCCCWHYCLE